jgi:hypothetical protein
MGTITLNCPHCQSDARVRNGHVLPMANNCIAAVGADVKAARPRLLMLIRKLVARRFCTQAQERSSLRGLTRTCCILFLMGFPYRKPKRVCCDAFSL